MKKKIVVFLVVGVLVLGLGISLAYFTPIITGAGKEISLVAKELKVIYTDTSAINNGLIVPGWTVTKSFTVENRSEDVYKYNIVIENLLNTFETEGFLQYRITGTNGGYTMTDFEDVPKTSEVTDTILAYSVEITDGAIQRYTIEFQYKETEEDQSADMGRSFSGNIMIEVGTEEPLDLPPFIAKLKEDNPSIMTRDANSFKTAFSGTGGLYQETDTKYLEEDGKTQSAVYYFSGDATNMNNWVKFGQEDGQDIWWRIIRTNEDGSVRLLYAGKGTEGHTTEEGYINKSKYNTTYSNPMYVGYMYGTTGDLAKNRTNGNDSDIKKTIDTWYTNNMLKVDGQNHPYGSYLSRTAVYCNDRATPAYSSSSEIYYAGYKRVVYSNNKRPSFKCGNDETGTLYKNPGSGSTIGGADVADRFTGSQKSTTKVGNQLLGDKPIALMTADEVAYAGGGWHSNNANAWYYQNSAGDSITGGTWWWTMSPYDADSDGWAFVFYVLDPSALFGNYVGSSGGVRPVVSLKSCVEVTGSGKTDDPYIPVAISEECALADN